jgi:hypothetical protein
MLDEYRELIDLLAQTPSRLKDGADAAGEPPEGEWGSAQIIGHLAATEYFFVERLNLLIREKAPRLRPFGAAATERFETLKDNNAATNLQIFNEFRGETVSMLMSLALNLWDRSGVHDTLGTLSVEDVVESMIDHDSEHLEQIDSLATS